MSAPARPSAVNAVVAAPPPPGHRLRVVRLGHDSSYDLADVHAMAGRVAAALQADGVGRGDRVGVLAANGLEWVLLDLACLRLGAVTAGFAPGQFTAGPELLQQYGLSLLFTDTSADTSGDTSADTSADAARPGAPEPGVRPVADVLRAADDAGLVAPPPVRWEPGDVTTLKFTSGSTGLPKGLAATVGSIDDSLAAVQELFEHGDGDDLFVFLPLSLLQQRYWIYSALVFGHDVTVSTYQAAFAALRAVRPTVVMGVPAFFDTARRHVEALASRDRTPGDLRAHAHRVFGGRIRYLWTGSAPANPAMLAFYTGVGLPLYEGYGLNETCIVSKNAPGAHREGSVGRVLPGKQVLFDEAGAITVRAEHPVNTAYAYAGPGESERVFGPGGVVRTGDLGHLDEDGYLWISGRADDVIVLANGRNLVTRPIEEQFTASPAIAECVLYYPGRTHLAAVVSPAPGAADGEGFEAVVSAHLAKVNSALGQDEQVRRVIVADPPFSVDGGLLTSQFKPQRRRIEQVYQSALDDPQRGIRAT